MSRILSCPFCGNDQNLSINIRFLNYFIKCNSCETEGPKAQDKEEANKLWNNRLSPNTSEDKSEGTTAKNPPDFSSKKPSALVSILITDELDVIKIARLAFEITRGKKKQ